MSLRLNGPALCIFGTCGQVATHRVSRETAFLPLCPAHRRMMEAEGLAVEPIPPRPLELHPAQRMPLRRTA